MITGEEIVAEVTDFSNGILTIKNALLVIPQQGQVGFMPWATVIDPDHPEIGLDMKHVIILLRLHPMWSHSMIKSLVTTSSSLRKS